MPELDTLRGVAIAMVVLYHGLYWSLTSQPLTHAARALGSYFHGGWSGVQLFFVLSGFLITGNLLDSAQRRGRFARFYWRRALRILPAFLLVLGAVVSLRMVTWQFALLSAAFLANLAPLAGVAMGYPVLWSLAVEEHFYAVWPAVVYNVRPRSVAIVSAVILFVEPVIRAVAVWRRLDGGLAFYTWFSVDGLAAGALLALLARNLSRRTFGSIAVAALILAGAIGGLLAVSGNTSRMTVAGGALTPTVLYAFFAGILSLALLAGSSRYRRLVNIAALQWLGYISYGLYLIHLICFDLFDRAVQPAGIRDLQFVLIRFAVAGSCAIGLAALSRYAFENRFLAMKDAFAHDRGSLDPIGENG
jgi:peptidoglycan/LPS O-acetylase OafA/YrhL